MLDRKYWRGSTICAVILLMGLGGCATPLPPPANSGAQSDNCVWAPMIEVADDGSCYISTKSGEANCWGGIDVTCVPNEESMTFRCVEEGGTASGEDSIIADVDTVSCDWFINEDNYNAYAVVWAETWDWDVDWFYW